MWVAMEAKRGIRSLGSGATSHYELLHMGTENQAQVFWKSSKES